MTNTLFIPAGIVAGMDGVTWWDALHSWLFAFLANVAGATIFVGGAYRYLHAREPEQQPGDTPSGRPAEPDPATAGRT